MLPREEDYFAGSVMLIVGLIGLTANVLVAFALFRTLQRSFSAFSLLCLSRSISNSGTILCFLLYAVPVSFLGHPFGPEVLGRKFGQLTTLTYKSLVYVQLAVALNRFVAIFLSIRYDRIYTKRNSCILLGLVWMMAIFHAVPEFIDGCSYTFFFDSLSWHFFDTPCSEILGGPVLFYPTYIVFSLSVGLNAVIFLRLTVYTMTMNRISGGAIASNDRHKRNVRCFVQSFIQELAYIFDIFINSQIKPSTRFTSFLCFSLVWESTHAFDGCAVLLYRSDLRSHFHCNDHRNRKVSRAPSSHF